MNFFITAIFSLSIAFGGITGWVRFRKIDPAFYPFVFLLWAGCVTEVISITLMRNGYSNIITFNVFVLAEALLIFYQFERWKMLPPTVWRTLPLILGSLWGLEILLRPAPAFCSYFIIGNSFAFVLLSISTINRIIFKESGSLIKNPIFLISLAFIFYFSFSALTETFWIFGIQQSSSFRLHISELHNYVNLFSNLIYAFAILWMPLKQDSILLS